VLRYLRLLQHADTIDKPVADAVMSEDVAAVIAAIGDQEVEDNNGAQEREVVLDALHKIADTDHLKAWLDWAYDPDITSGAPQTFTRFLDTIDTYARIYTDKPFPSDVLRNLRYYTPQSAPPEPRQAYSHAPEIQDVFKWVRPVRRKRSPPPPPPAPRGSDWYTDNIATLDPETDVMAQWRGAHPNRARPPRWYIKFFLKRPLPGVSPWFEREDSGDRSGWHYARSSRIS
jgi:hypothetical protein